MNCKYLLGFSLVAVLVLTISCGTGMALTWSHANIPDDDTLALWHLDDGSGSSATNEIDGGPSLTMNDSDGWAGTGAGWLNTPAGDWIDAGDTNSYGSLTSGGPTVVWSDGVTISYWLYAPENPDGTYVIFWMEAPVRTIFYWVLNGGTAGRVRVQIKVDGTDYTTDLQNIDVGWHHIAFVYNPALGTYGRWTLYVDNAAVSGAIEPTAPPPDGGLTLRIGGNYYGGEAPGGFDELLIQNAVMTSFLDGLEPPPDAGTVISIK